jgi:hypothetical protein
MLPNPPDGWGQDEITKFLDTVRGNEYATFANIRPSVRHYVGIDKAFRKAIESLYNTKDWFAAFFLLRAHSNFLASVRLVMSGQVPETYQRYVLV